jgi:multicomponent Na+:H+ antiporter subunit F
VIDLAIVLLGIGAVCFVTRLLLGPSLADRVVALDGLIVTAVAFTVVFSMQSDSTKFLDLAVVFAIVGFLGTAAAARYIERRGG